MPQLDPQTARLLDELEQLIENAKGGIFGKRIIDEEEFFVKMTQLRAHLSQNPASPTMPAPLASPDPFHSR